LGVNLFDLNLLINVQVSILRKSKLSFEFEIPFESNLFQQPNISKRTSISFLHFGPKFPAHPLPFSFFSSKPQAHSAFLAQPWPTSPWPSSTFGQRNNAAVSAIFADATAAMGASGHLPSMEPTPLDLLSHFPPLIGTPLFLSLITSVLNQHFAAGHSSHPGPLSHRLRLYKRGPKPHRPPRTPFLWCWRSPNQSITL
jgi:hypothetical protein